MRSSKIFNWFETLQNLAPNLDLAHFAMFLARLQKTPSTILFWSQRNRICNFKNTQIGTKMYKLFSIHEFISTYVTFGTHGTILDPKNKQTNFAKKSCLHAWKKKAIKESLLTRFFSTKVLILALLFQPSLALAYTLTEGWCSWHSNLAFSSPCLLASMDFDRERGGGEPYHTPWYYMPNFRFLVYSPTPRSNVTFPFNG